MLAKGAVDADEWLTVLPVSRLQSSFDAPNVGPGFGIQF